jgi:hypothetical protein
MATDETNYLFIPFLGFTHTHMIQIFPINITKTIALFI